VVAFGRGSILHVLSPEIWFSVLKPRIELASETTRAVKAVGDGPLARKWTWAQNAIWTRSSPSTPLQMPRGGSNVVANQGKLGSAPYIVQGSSNRRMASRKKTAAEVVRQVNFRPESCANGSIEF